MTPDFMVRVKLPKAAHYTRFAAYEMAFEKALSDVCPDGFDFVCPEKNEKWPVDSEGYTWARLRCSGEDASLAFWVSRTRELEELLEKINASSEAITRLVKAAGGPTQLD